VPPAGVAVPGERPQASPLVLTQAAPGAQVTALANQSVRINDEPTALLLSLLDGTRDRAAIRADFEARGLGQLAPEALEEALAAFGRAGLLVA
jgi:hypothetical protein